MLRAASSFVRFFRPYSVLLMKHFLYPNVLRRHRFFGSYTRAQVLLHLLYLAVNIFYSIFGVSSIKELGTQTGTLSLINMIPAYSQPIKKNTRKVGLAVVREGEGGGRRRRSAPTGLDFLRHRLPRQSRDIVGPSLRHYRVPRLRAEDARGGVGWKGGRPPPHGD